MMKQFLGAGAGMAIAAIVYFGINQASDMNIKGLLVSTDTVSTSTGVSVNDKNVSEATLRTIISRAKTVATTLSESEAPVAVADPINERAAKRAEDRKVATASAEARANAPTYVNDPNAVVSQQERVALRAARFGAAPNVASSASSPATTKVEVAGVSGYPVYVPQTVIQRVEVPVDREVIKEVPVEVIKEVPVIKEVIREVPVDREVIREVIKEVPVDRQVIKEVPVYITTPGSEKGPNVISYRDLSDSGPGLFVLVGSSAMLALGRVYRRKKSSM